MGIVADALWYNCAQFFCVKGLYAKFVNSNEGRREMKNLMIVAAIAAIVGVTAVASADDVPWIDLTGTNRVPDSSASSSSVGVFDSIGVCSVISRSGNLYTIPVGMILSFR